MKDRAIRRQVRAGVVMLVLFGFVVGLRANEAPTRVLHFPQDQFMGRKSVEDPNLGSS